MYTLMDTPSGVLSVDAKDFDLRRLSGTIGPEQLRRERRYGWYQLQLLTHLLTIAICLFARFLWAFYGECSRRMATEKQREWNISTK